MDGGSWWRSKSSPAPDSRPHKPLMTRGNTLLRKRLCVCDWRRDSKPTVFHTGFELVVELEHRLQAGWGTQMTTSALPVGIACLGNFTAVSRVRGDQTLPIRVCHFYPSLPLSRTFSIRAAHTRRAPRERRTFSPCASPLSWPRIALTGTGGHVCSLMSNFSSSTSCPPLLRSRCSLLRSCEGSDCHPPSAMLSRFPAHGKHEWRTLDGEVLEPMTALSRPRHRRRRASPPGSNRATDAVAH